jgi:hypothetical protein
VLRAAENLEPLPSFSSARAGAGDGIRAGSVEAAEGMISALKKMNRRAET